MGQGQYPKETIFEGQDDNFFSDRTRLCYVVETVNEPLEHSVTDIKRV